MKILSPLSLHISWLEKSIVVFLATLVLIQPVYADHVQKTKLTASDGAASDGFGFVAAISADSLYALIGTSGKNAAYVFTRSGSNWSQQAKLTATGSQGFGTATDIDDTGIYSVIGDDKKDVGANSQQGRLHIFTRSGTSWSEQAALTASDGGANDQFGQRVAISDNGDYVIVGVLKDDIGSNTDQGSAYIFTRSGTSWSEQAKLTASDGAIYDNFGSAVAISSAGDYVAIGAQQADPTGASDAGKVYIFTRSGTSWSEQAIITASGHASGDSLGSAIAMNDAGDYVIAGARYDDVGANSNQGSAVIFTRSGTTWSQQARITADDGAASDSFGETSIAIENTNADTALIGVRLNDVGSNTDQGSAYIFTRSGSTWTQHSQLTASDGAASDQYGFSVRMDEGADYFLSGANLDNVESTTDQGSAYIFVTAAIHAPEFTTMVFFTMLLILLAIFFIKMRKFRMQALTS